MTVKRMTMTASLQRSCKTLPDKIMEYQSNNSASNAAQDAKNSASDAADTIKSAASDATSQFRSSAAKAADQAQQAGGKLVDATKAYANDAVDAAGRKLSDMKSQLETAKANATEYINDDPVRAVKIAAIGGALLSAALLMLTRRSR
jgi:ElaB/YqjD/DUF883 family membrane-anchored ribosome-binding protein